MRRVLITGMAGSGKTTLARRMSKATRLPWFPLDDLYYGPGLARAASFPAAIERITAGNTWIFDAGGPPPIDTIAARLRELMWTRADTLVWLDYTQSVVIRRATIRSLRRIVTRQRLSRSTLAARPNPRLPGSDYVT
jgi:adenylate kinase family enzyme